MTGILMSQSPSNSLTAAGVHESDGIPDCISSLAVTLALTDPCFFLSCLSNFFMINGLSTDYSLSNENLLLKRPPPVTF